MRGRAHKYRDDVNTDEIIPARYLNTSDPEELAAHCMEDIDADFVRKVKPGDIIVGGRNFGCGSSREHAPLAIKTAGVSCVIARSFARIFFRNSINIGLPVLECSDTDRIDDGDELEVNLATGAIVNQTKGETYQATPLPDFVREIVDEGGLIEYARKLVSERGETGNLS